MSLTEKTTFDCPNCGKPVETTIWNSINVILDPEMKEKVKDGSIFIHTCPHCNAKIKGHYNTLYHDMDKRIMVYFIEGASGEDSAILDKSFAQISSLFSPNGVKEHYIKRFVNTVDDFLEEVNVLDAGLDDRIAEMIKLFVINNYLEEYPEDKDKDLHAMFAIKNGEYAVLIFGGSGGTKGCNITKEEYQSFCDEFLPELPEIWETKNAFEDVLACFKKQPTEN